MSLRVLRAGIGSTVAIGLAFAALEGRHLAATSAYERSILPVCRVETDRPMVALTFDDGPDPVYTAQVLGLLEANGASATFFVVGAQAAAHAELVDRELSAGMEVADHTWSHARLDEVSASDALTEIERTSSFVAELGSTSNLLRAPFGEITPDELQSIGQTGLRAVHWSIALDHYVGGLGLSPSIAAEAILRDVRPGDILLAHDASLVLGSGRGGRDEAMRTLRLLVPALRRRGFAIVTVSELLHSGQPVPAEPRGWFWQSGFTCPSR